MKKISMLILTVVLVFGVGGNAMAERAEGTFSWIAPYGGDFQNLDPHISARTNDYLALINIMLSIPPMIFALAIMALLGPGFINVFIALGLTNWSYSCRITRSQVLAARSMNYVIAALALGYSNIRIMFTQILPNIIGPILVIATLGVAYAIFLEAALSFLGLGAQPPNPSWGGMLATARDQFFTTPWISIFPGVAIFITVLGLNLFGDGLRDILDPHVTRK